MTTYIVELCESCWLAGWAGDPGRTTVIENARRYRSKRAAVSALSYARRFRSFANAKIIEVTEAAS